MDHISQYTNLFGVKPRAATATPAGGASAPVANVQAADSIQLTANNTAVPTTAMTATATADMRTELLALRKELMDINKQLEAMITRLEASQPTVASDDEVPEVEATEEVAPETAAVAGTYTVKANDYLWKIAQNELGDASRWPEIYALNQEAIGGNPNIVQPGTELKMPAPSPKPQIPSPTPGQASPQTPTVPTPQLPTPPVSQPPVPSAPPMAPPLPPMPPAPPPPAPVLPQPQQQNAGVSDVPAGRPSNRQMNDAEALRISTEFGLSRPGMPLTAEARANVGVFLDELDSYEKEHRGKVFGPGMEALATSADEGNRIRQSVQQIQQALALLIKGGKLRPIVGGQPVQDLPLTGSFFKMDAQGRELKDARGNAVMDDAFVAAITQFKQDRGIHQNYKLADGSYGINEYVGPATVEALKKALLELQGR